MWRHGDGAFRRSVDQSTAPVTTGAATMSNITKIPAPTSPPPRVPVGATPPFANGGSGAFPNYMQPKVGSSRIPFSLALALLANVPLGYIREQFTSKYSIFWFASIHASIPLLYAWRKKYIPYPPQWLIPMNILCAVAGQLIGGKVRSQDLDQTLLIEGKDV
jgi:hypothetical protein